VPTGIPASPLGDVKPFTQPMLRFDLLPRRPFAFSQPGIPGTLTPDPTEEANTTKQLLNPTLVGGRTDQYGPIEGRPSGADWAHQEFRRFPPRIAIEVTQEGARTNLEYDADCDEQFNSGVRRGALCPPVFHPALPLQDPLKLWTFNGSVPPKLMVGRYGEPILFRHRNKLPFDLKDNGNFGRHTISTHEHNGHHGAENDGFTGAFFFPGQFYDYHYPILLGGFRGICCCRVVAIHNWNGNIRLHRFSFRTMRCERVETDIWLDQPVRRNGALLESRQSGPHLPKCGR